MDKNTLNSLNSSYIKLFEDEAGIVRVGIALEDILSGKVLITTNEVTEENLLQEVHTATSAPLVIIPDGLITLYKKAGCDDNSVHEDIYEYLQIVAELWNSTNKTESAVTGSLIGKVSKRSSKLNETVYRMVGSDTRDTMLKELIKCNMPMLKYMWGQNK